MFVVLCTFDYRILEVILGALRTYVFISQCMPEMNETEVWRMYTIYMGYSLS